MDQTGDANRFALAFWRWPSPLFSKLGELYLSLLRCEGLVMHVGCHCPGSAKTVLTEPPSSRSHSPCTNAVDRGSLVPAQGLVSAVLRRAPIRQMCGPHGKRNQPIRSPVTPRHCHCLGPHAPVGIDKIDLRTGPEVLRAATRLSTLWTVLASWDYIRYGTPAKWHYGFWPDRLPAK